LGVCGLSALVAYGPRAQVVVEARAEARKRRSRRPRAVVKVVATRRRAWGTQAACRGVRWPPCCCTPSPTAFLGDAKSSLHDAKSSLDDAESSLGDAKSLLGDAESSLGDAKSSLGDAESSLGDAKSSLGDAKSSLGDA
jgi:hypothetical protein